MKRRAAVLIVCFLIVLGNVGAQSAPGETGAIVHLLNRAGYGPRPGDVERVTAIGGAAYIEEQLHPSAIDDAETIARLEALNTLTMDPIAIRNSYRADPRPVVEQLQAQKMIRAIYSRRQLQEVMVGFWLNHFNVNWSKDGMQFVVTGYEQDAIRPNALGDFPSLLLAVAKHPAMLVYLDNATSSSAGVNENYARELLELHTVGVDGGYTQKDVEDVARVFTGWTVTADGTAFEFREDLHAGGEKRVLAQAIPAGGYQEGETLLAILARHPNTARFIATKLVRRFVSDDPPAELVHRVAESFLNTGGDISAMLRTILISKEFAAPEVMRGKAKSPFELVVSSIRAVDATLLDSLNGQSVQGFLRSLPPDDVVLSKSGSGRVRVSPAVILTRMIQEMGQFPYQNAEPTGYPDHHDFWVNGWSALHRVNFAVSLVNNEILGTSVDAAKLEGMLASAPNAEESWKRALDVVLSPSAAATVFEPSPDTIRAFALALGSPDFQNR